MLDQDRNFYQIGSSILITCLQGGVCKLYGEVTCSSPLGVNGLRCNSILIPES